MERIVHAVPRHWNVHAFLLFHLLLPALLSEKGWRRHCFALVIHSVAMILCEAVPSNMYWPNVVYLRFIVDPMAELTKVILILRGALSRGSLSWILKPSSWADFDSRLKVKKQRMRPLSMRLQFFSFVSVNIQSKELRSILFRISERLTGVWLIWRYHDCLLLFPSWQLTLNALRYHHFVI